MKFGVPNDVVRLTKEQAERLFETLRPNHRGWEFEEGSKAIQELLLKTWIAGYVYGSERKT
jgi:hypothetical protein